MDLQFTPQEEAFRAEVQSFLKDKLPKRLTDVLQDPGDPKSRVPLEQMKRIYYRARGWGENGLPDEAKLRKLGIIE